ncbi:MAG TPA: YceI family protein [Fibrella sp.]|jgi:polyisoprenoid-binding protein YceI
MENQAQLTAWGIDKSHTSINFTITHFMIARVKGQFTEFSGTLSTPSDDFDGAEIDLTIEAASISTNDVNRDNHLKTADFLDVASHPQIRFASTAFRHLGDNQYAIDGLLTVNGIEKPNTLHASYSGQFQHPVYKNTIAYFEVQANIPRLDFTIGASYPAAVLGEVVKLNSTLELVRQA